MFGDLRLEGWAEAWRDIFTTIDNLEANEAETVLKAMSDELWRKHSYHPDELDRVVLCVEHEVREGDRTTARAGTSASGFLGGAVIIGLVLATGLAVKTVRKKRRNAGITPHQGL